MGGENDLCARKPQSESPDDDVGRLLRPSIPRRVWPVAPAREREQRLMPRNSLHDKMTRTGGQI